MHVYFAFTLVKACKSEELCVRIWSVQTGICTLGFWWLPSTETHYSEFWKMNLISDCAPIFTSVPLKLKGCWWYSWSCFLCWCFRGNKVCSFCPLQNFAGAVMCQKQALDKYSTSNLQVFLVALSAEWWINLKSNCCITNDLHNSWCKVWFWVSFQSAVCFKTFIIPLMYKRLLKMYRKDWASKRCVPH